MNRECLSIIPITSDILMCQDQLSTPADLYRVIERTTVTKRIEPNFIYPMWKFEPDKNMEDYKTTGTVRGMVVVPQKGDIFITGLGGPSIKYHSAIMFGNKYFYSQGGTDQIFLDCTGSGCDMSFLTHKANPPFPKQKYFCSIMRYRGPHSKEIRAEVVRTAIEMAKLSSYSLKKVCRVVSPSNPCRVNNKILLQKARKYIRMMEQNKPIEQICSSFVIFVYLIAFVKVFERNGTPLNLSKYFPLHPRYCLPRDLVKLAREKPRYWVEVTIPHWEKPKNAGVYTMDKSREFIADRVQSVYIKHIDD